jgi:hypothetical protein
LVILKTPQILEKTMINAKKFAKIEKTLGGLKFAVILLSLFALFMVVGTFFESYYGTDFANRTVYKTWPFMLLQFGMFISITFAAFVRLPPKKRLYGFYTIHSGLIIIGCGSFMTYYAGVDGSLVLPPNSPSREVILSDDILKMRFADDGRVVTFKLPYPGFETDVKKNYQDITLARFYPFAEKEFIWQTAKKKVNASEPVHSSSYSISNPMVTQDFTLSLHPESIDFESNVNLGPLTIHYLPSSLGKCFGKNNASKLILWDREEASCYTPEERNIAVKTTDQGRRVLLVKKGDQLLSFLPDMSPWPLDKNMQLMRGAGLRVFSKSLFEKKPNLFLFGESTAFYDKDEEIWTYQEFAKDNAISLPWMGFEIILAEHKKEEVPTYRPKSVLPIQKNNEIIRGNVKALELIVLNESYWVTNEKPIQLLINGKKVIFSLQKESITLPFEFVLTKFKMEKDPGTQRAASYESYVRLFSGEENNEHHIFMNNPLKSSGFTFYQASYSQDRQGNYSSTLSVNVDPGRPFKYAGSLMLVLGSMWHYALNYRKRKKTKITPLIATKEDEHSDESSS